MFHSDGGDPDATEVTDWELQRYFEWVHGMWRWQGRR